MNPETKSADALARELAERAMRSINSGYCDSVKPIRPDEVSEIILSKTKLRELCAVAEALREIMQLISEGHIVRNVSGDSEPGWAMKQVPFVMTLSRAEQALAALDGGGK